METTTMGLYRNKGKDNETTMWGLGFKVKGWSPKGGYMGAFRRE